MSTAFSVVQAKYRPVMATRRPTKGLLDLPRELRDQIYEYLVFKPKNTITMLPNYGSFQSVVSAAQPAICGVNKQIRSETLPIFYGSNLFLAEISESTDLAIAKNWLSAIEGDNICHLRRLALCGWTKVVFGHMTCRLWIRIVFDLRDGTLEIEGNEAKVDQHSHVVKDAKELKAAYQDMVAAMEGKGFDASTLALLMEGFNGLCTSY